MTDSSLPRTTCKLRAVAMQARVLPGSAPGARALPGGLQGDTGAAPLAVVAVGLVVTAADRGEDVLADVRRHDAAAGPPAGAGGELAELPGPRAVRVVAADLRPLRVRPAVPLAHLPHAGLEPLALVGIGGPVAAADLRPLLRADVVDRDADAREIGGVALPLRIPAGLPCPALAVVGATAALRRLGLRRQPRGEQTEPEGHGDDGFLTHGEPSFQRTRAASPAPPRAIHQIPTRRKIQRRLRTPRRKKLWTGKGTASGARSRTSR